MSTHIVHTELVERLATAVLVDRRSERVGDRVAGWQPVRRLLAGASGRVVRRVRLQSGAFTRVATHRVPLRSYSMLTGAAAADLSIGAATLQEALYNPTDCNYSNKLSRWHKYFVALLARDIANAHALRRAPCASPVAQMEATTRDMLCHGNHQCTEDCLLSLRLT